MRDDLLKDVVRVRRAYRRVFAPMPGEQLTGDEAEMDRAIVLADLREFCHVDAVITPSWGAEVGLQLAMSEGRRSVGIRILSAIKKGKQDLMAKPEVKA